MNTIEYSYTDVHQYRSRWQDQDPHAKAVIFVHGILANAKTFRAMADSFVKDPRFDEWDLGYFGYDFNRSMPDNGRDLATEVARLYAPNATVIVVAHSMGGLVARLAIMMKKLASVRRLIMLATPNRGAVRPGQLALFAQMALTGLGQVWAIFPNKTGIRDLTRVTTVFQEYVASRDCIENAAHVEYITIPGQYFNIDRGTFEIPASGASFPMSLLNDIIMWTQCCPGVAASLDRPHDGIVEERSVYLSATDTSFYYEKSHAIRFPVTDEPPYAHVAHRRCLDLTHLTITTDEAVMSLVRELAVASDIKTWYLCLGATNYELTLDVPGPERFRARSVAKNDSKARDTLHRLSPSAQKAVERRRPGRRCR